MKYTNINNPKGGIMNEEIKTLETLIFEIEIKEIENEDQELERINAILSIRNAIKTLKEIEVA